MTKKPEQAVKAKLTLDVGCGANCHPGAVGMDVRELPGVDIVHDAEIFPWPLEAGVCSVVIMSHFVEHVKPWLQVQLMDEVWRVTEPGGMVMISTPYGGSFRYNQDPTHCAPWNEATVDYFVEGSGLYEVYRPRPWKLNELNGRVHKMWSVHGDLEVGLVKVVKEGQPDG